MRYIFSSFMLSAMIFLGGCGSSSVDHYVKDENTTTRLEDKGMYLAPYLQETGLKLLIPLYIYPSDTSIDWRRLIDFKQTNQEIEIIVIVNPNNGVFSVADAHYVQGIRDLIAADIKVIGYVYTGYAKRDIYEVEADIEAWSTIYKEEGVSGIFFDETSTNALDLEYYRILSEYARGDDLNFVVLNPGTKTDRTFITSAIADIIVSYEHTYDKFTRVTDWNTPEGNTSLAMMIYDMNDTAMVQTVQKAVDEHFEYIYFTENPSASRWDTLSKYLGEY
jgi:hypothetical protein